MLVRVAFDKIFGGWCPEVELAFLILAVVLLPSYLVDDTVMFVCLCFDGCLVRCSS